MPLILGLLLPVAACSGQPALTPPAGDQPTAQPVVLAQPQWRAEDPVPAPSGPVVLTLTGKITRTNGSDALRLDPAMLDRLGVVQAAVYDPWVKKELQFRGTWLADLVKAAGADGSARSIHLTALDDYQIDLGMSDIMAGGILLATRTGDGAAIPVEEGGPLRIVFVGGVPSGASADQWIWSLAKIDVR